MIAAYFETRFRTEEMFESWPDDFSIITAYATTGEIWSDGLNISQDRRLEGELSRLTAEPRRIIGYSPSSGHAEPGWAVEINLSEALRIGRNFRQDAIYQIRSGDIWVISCSKPNDAFFVDRFLSRLD